MDYLDAALAFLIAMAITVALTPAAARFARKVGALSPARDRDLGIPDTPQLGGLAILAGVVVAAFVFLPGTIRLAHAAGARPGSHGTTHTWAIVAGACVITLVGAVDDALELAVPWKFLGQLAAAGIAVAGGVVVTDLTLPFVGSLSFPHEGWVLSLIWLVGMMNVVNFSDGVDGLAAGLCAIDGVAFAIIAFDLGASSAAVLAALTAGASLGFLFHNRYPASSFMGDTGANLLGYLLGVVSIIGSLKTNTLLALLLPLCILAVPFLNIGFVVTKRVKSGQMPWASGSEHFHNRMARIGYSQPKIVAYLYGWALMFAGVALALRFVPYSDHHGHYRLGWSLVIGAIVLIALAASTYLAYLLEIPKYKPKTAIRVRRMIADKRRPPRERVRS